ncbi:arylsulfatase, partial [Elizabethkingia meningoseptica]|nr:arylsulfatase [Elizabethkingia meningoseptica]
EGGTRIPFIVNAPKKVKKGETDALISQIDLFSSFASLNKQSLKPGQAFDSFNMLKQLMGESRENRPYLIEDAYGIAIIKDHWKYIKPNNRNAYLKETETELGNSPQPQLYNLKTDEKERINLAAKYPDKVNELAGLLEEVMKKK